MRSYRGVSADDRRLERRARLLEALLDTVLDVGVLDTTVEAVCARAGLTKRYFYESFGDRDEILAVAIDAMFVDVLEAIRAALTGASPTVADRATVTVGALVDELDRDRRRARMYVEAPGHPVLRARRDAAIDTFADLLMSDVLQASPPDDRHRMVGLLVVAGTTEVVSRWLADGLPLGRDDLVEEIARIGVAVGGL